jgi:hypothetical protein
MMAARIEVTSRGLRAKRTLSLHSRGDVTRALRSPSHWFWGSITLEIGAGFGTQRQRDALVRRMTLWLEICGCRIAALLALTVLAWQGWSAYVQGVAGLWLVAEPLGAAIAAATVAKLTALLLSRGLFILELARLLTVVSSDPQSEVRQ